MKKLRLILPILAFVFAIAVSYATVNAKPASVATKRVSYPTNCQDIGSCTTGGNDLCRDDMGNLVREFISTTNCQSSFNGTWDE